MVQTITYDGTNTITINDNTFDSENTDLNLPGNGITRYGESINQNWINLVENFYSHESLRKPINGQIWFDPNDHNLKILKDNKWVIIPRLEISGNPPNTITNNLWIDTNDNKIKYNDNNNDWIEISYIDDEVGAFKSVIRNDVDNNSHTTFEIILNNYIVAILSNDDTWIPNNDERDIRENKLINTFPSIECGININNNFNINSDIVDSYINDYFERSTSGTVTVSGENISIPTYNNGKILNKFIPTFNLDVNTSNIENTIDGIVNSFVDNRIRNVINNVPQLESNGKFPKDILPLDLLTSLIPLDSLIDFRVNINGSFVPPEGTSTIFVMTGYSFCLLKNISNYSNMRIITNYPNSSTSQVITGTNVPNYGHTNHKQIQANTYIPSLTQGDPHNIVLCFR